MTDYFDALHERNGNFSPGVPITTETIERYRAVLPSLLIEIWEKLGVGVWKQGLFQLVDPDSMSPLLSDVFDDDAQLSPETVHIVGYSAFGQLMFWSETYGLGYVDLLNGLVYCRGVIEPTPLTADMFSYIALSQLRASAPNLAGTDDKPLFKRAVRRFGALEPGECFGFFPALPLGGAQSLFNLRRVRALEHFSFVAQLASFVLVDFRSSPPSVARPIG